MNRRSRPTGGHPPSARVALESAVTGGTPFRAASALEHRIVTRHGLSTRYRALLPGVYISNDASPTAADHIRAAALWAPAGSVIGGWAAARLHGERWYSERRCADSVDLYSARALRAPKGVRVRILRRPLAPDDLARADDIATTAPGRTAVDVGRWTTGLDRRICAIDSVCNAARIGLGDVSAAAGRMSGQHGVADVLHLLAECDPRADSPRESLLRLTIHRSDLPRPVSQLRIRNEYGAVVATADLGYEREKVAIFYDGAHHGRPDQWKFDAGVNAELTDLGWEVLRVVSQMTPATVLHRIARALARGSQRNGL